MISKRDVIVGGVGLVVAGLGWLGITQYQDSKQPKWMQDLVRAYDPKHIGETGYIYLPLACFDTLGPGGQIVPNATVVYAYAKLDVNLKSGALRVMSSQLPDANFKCPDKQAPAVPSQLPNNVPKAPAPTKPIVPAAPAKK